MLNSKILFFFDDDFVNFGITNALQNMMTGVDFYAIHALSGNKLHSFYNNQTIVKFKKKWFLKIENFNKKPDIQYLENFEKKFNVNLHKIIFLERVFYEFDYFHHFSYDEILLILENECRFFETILDDLKPDFLCLKLTDWHDGYLLTEMCRSKGIKVLTFTPTRFRYKYAISDEYDDFDFKTDTPSNSQKIRNFDELQKYLHNSSYKNIIDSVVDMYSVYKFESIIDWLKNYFFNTNISFTAHWKYRGQTRFKLLKSGITNLIKKNIRMNFLNNNSMKTLHSNEKFIYFPLHFQPERSTLIDTPYHNDQISIITNISKSLPIGYVLYVKEHPFMSYGGWREISYYKKILALPNVKLIHPSISNDDLFNNCSLVISIFGTSGLEAGFYNKPSILFVNSSYSYFPFVHVLSNLDELPSIIRKMLKIKVDPIFLNDYINKLENNTFEINLDKLRYEINKSFFFNGTIPDVHLDENKVKSFFTKFESDFTIIAKEYLKKLSIDV